MSKYKHYKTIQINGKQIRLHRYLMEQKIGRKLNSNEIVHHINGNNYDNRMENLEVLSRSEHLEKHPEVLEAYIDKNTYKFNKKDLIEMYKKYVISDIAKMFGVSPMTIWYRLKKYGVKTKKLSDNEVVIIRIMLLDGVKQRDIAKKYDISPQMVTDIKKNRRYKNVK